MTWSASSVSGTESYGPVRQTSSRQSTLFICSWLTDVVAPLLPDNTGDYNWRENFAMDWARVGALSLLPISAHTTIAQHARMLQLSDDFDRYHLGLSEVPVRTHIPILPIERLPSFNAHGRHPGSYVHSDREKGDGLGEKRAMETPSSDWTGPVDTHWGRRDGKVLRDAVIQGGFDRGRRDYEGVMKDLLAELEGPSGIPARLFASSSPLTRAASSQRTQQPGATSPLQKELPSFQRTSTTLCSILLAMGTRLASFLTD